jgi:hypothetical protein
LLGTAQLGKPRVIAQFRTAARRLRARWSLLSFARRVALCVPARARVRACVRACVRARVRACARACVRGRVGGGCVRASVVGVHVCVLSNVVLRAASLLIFEGPRGATPQPIDQLRCLLLLLGEEVYMVGNANTPTAKGATLTKADI